MISQKIHPHFFSRSPEHFGGKIPFIVTDLVQKLRENGYNTLNTVTSVIPIIVGDEYKLTQMSKDLLDRGIYVSCIFPPAVPKNTARIRVNMNPLVTEEDIDYFIEQLNEIFQIYQLDRFVKV